MRGDSRHRPPDAELLRRLAQTLGMVPIDVAEEDRTAYHAAASLASNALVALQVAAAELAATAGVPASALQPLARAALTQVGASGSAALTGPAARGDWATVAAQRDAIEARTPHLLPLFDATHRRLRRPRGCRPHPRSRDLGVPLMLVPSSTLTVVRTAAELRRAVDAARALGQRVGFVPTMGALHAGHATLIQAAAADSTPSSSRSSSTRRSSTTPAT